jgi:stage II sporulation protein D
LSKLLPIKRVSPNVVTSIMKARLLICFALLALPASAGASSRFTIRGAGFGHGVGMSQYGAYGYAQHGWTYDDILAHYYSDTELGTAGDKVVRVLIQGSVSSAAVSGATSAGGRQLSPSKTYYVRHGAGSNTVDLVSASGKRLKHVTTMLTLRGAELRLGGVGVYRHAFQFRPSGTMGIQTVNALGLEAYVRGVVSRESPASWPAEALKAQAVAARTYALTTSKGGNGFDQYPDTRSQVYGGVAAETAATDDAVRATRHEVVTYEGEPVVTYFFSTSGGRTENVEYSFSGSEPEPWLKSVKDPYDDTSPKHRWGPIRMTKASAGSDLSGLVKGSFKGIDVIERGRSPRIVLADVVGSGGRTRVSGATLRARFGTYDTWMYFTSIKSGEGPKAEEDRLGADPEARAARAGHVLAGEVFPAVKGAAITVQRRTRHGWRTVGETRTTRGGRYRYVARSAGRYRVRYLLDAGPAVGLR